MIDLKGKVSEADKEATYAQSNPPEFENGFEATSTDSDDGDFSSLSGSFDFGSESGGDSGGFGGDSGGFGSDSGGFGSFDSAGGFGGFGQSMGGALTTQQEAKPDTMDKAVDYSAESIVALGRMLVDFFKSVKLRNYDDWAYIGTKMLYIGGAITGASVVALIIGLFSGFTPFKFTNAPLSGMTWGIFTGSSGLACLATMALLKVRAGDFGATETAASIPDVSDSMPDSSGLDNSFDFGMDNSSTTDSLMNSILSGDGDDSTDEPEDKADDGDDLSSLFVKDDEPKKGLSASEMVDKLQEVEGGLTRPVLVDRLMPLFPTNTPDFANMKELDLDGDEALTIRTLLKQALASACGKEEDEITLNVTRIQSTEFCYIINFERHKSINKDPDKFKDEIVNFFKGSVDDNSVSVDVKILGKEYECILSKGVSAVITMGDCFKKKEVVDYIKDPKHKLPFIMGVDELGKVYMGDAKDYPSLLIVGMSRSGKSWYVNSFITALASFNTPEDIQFLIIDPKESLLFKTVALLPHCCGLHNNANILNILDDVLNKEAPRRKQLLADERCETIWDLRKKGIQLPYLYIVIDEVMTVIKSLQADGRDKDFLNTIIQIITQLPSLGIGVLMVPHRAQGVVDKTTRGQMHFRAAVRASDEVVKETLDITKFDRALINPGDIALRTSNLPKPIFVKGTGITLSDEDNIQLIANIARAFYKMSVELPDMETLGCGYNRDTEKVKEELKITLGKKEQFDLES